MPLNEGAINEIFPFAEEGQEAAGDILSLEEYAVHLLRKRGHMPGLALREVQNRAGRQAAHMAAGLAQFIANRYAPGVVDDADLDKVEAGLLAAVETLVPGAPPMATETAPGLAPRLATNSEAARADGIGLVCAAQMPLTGSFPGELLQSFDSAGTYSFAAPDPFNDGKPFPVEVWVKAGGGGGGGGFYRSDYGNVGGQGGGEGESVIVCATVTPGNAYAITVGAGGVGGARGAAAFSTAGANGASSSFAVVATAEGGFGGGPGTVGAASGLGGGVSSVSSAMLRYRGAAGSIGDRTSNIGFSNTGGGSGGGSGGGRSNMSIAAGGDSSGNGVYGAGGGGGSAYGSGSIAYAGGNGGNGYVIIWRVRR